MTEQQQRLKQTLSALADGEANELELQRILRELDGDAAPLLRQRWQSYHQQRALMRGERFAAGDISAAVSAAIAAEPAHRKSRWNSALGSLSRVAVAASVALFALVAVQQFDGVGNQPPALEFAQESLDADHYNGPALQFPSGFRPELNAQTVSARSAGSDRASSAALPLNVGMSEADYLHSRSYLLNLLERHQRQSATIANPALLPVMLLATLPSDR